MDWRFYVQIANPTYPVLGVHSQVLPIQKNVYPVHILGGKILQRVFFHWQLLCQYYIYQAPLVLGPFVFLVENCYPEEYERYMMQNLTCALFSFSTAECGCPARRGYLADFVWSRRILRDPFQYLSSCEESISIPKEGCSVNCAGPVCCTCSSLKNDYQTWTAGLWLGTPCSVLSLSPLPFPHRHRTW